MPDQKPVLKLGIGDIAEVKLLKDNPITGSNSNGDYNMYPVIHEGVEKVHFASAFAHERLIDFKKGDIVSIEHKPLPNGKSVYDVVLVEESNSNRKTSSGKSPSSDTDLAIKWGMAFNNATRIVIAKHGISKSMGDNDSLVQDVKDLSNKLFEVACSMPTQPDEDTDSLPWD